MKTNNEAFLITEVRGSKNAREDFIVEHKGFIASVASEVCKRRLVWENDEELSVALLAFNEAIDGFDTDKSSFYGFARVVIKRRLVDHFRREQKHRHLRLINPLTDEEDETIWDRDQALKQYQSNSEKQDRLREIDTLNKCLRGFGISFSDLVDGSPAHSDTRERLFDAAQTICTEKSVLDYIMEKKRLPLRQLMLLTTLSKKILKTWRKYLIALIIISSHAELHMLREFIGVKGGVNNG